MSEPMNDGVAAIERLRRLLCLLGFHREGEQFDTSNGYIIPCAYCGAWLEEFEWDW